MHARSRLISVATSAALLFGTAGSAFAQTTPAQTAPAPLPVSASPIPAPSPMETAPPATVVPTTMPATAAPLPAHGKSSMPHVNRGKHLGQLKKIASGTLTSSQVTYAFTHMPQEVLKVRAMHTLKFQNLRVYRLSSLQKARLKIGYAQYDAIAQALYGPTQTYASTTMIAQTNLGGSAMNLLHNVLANVNVSDALNNVLNNSNVNLNAVVTLSDVLNNVNVGIGQVVGIYVGSGGVVTSIVG